jgi:hypothetical protein
MYGQSNNASMRIKFNKESVTMVPVWLLTLSPGVNFRHCWVPGPLEQGVPAPVVESEVLPLSPELSVQGELSSTANEAIRISGMSSDSIGFSESSSATRHLKWSWWCRIKWPSLSFTRKEIDHLEQRQASISVLYRAYTPFLPLISTFYELHCHAVTSASFDSVIVVTRKVTHQSCSGEVIMR